MYISKILKSNKKLHRFDTIILALNAVAALVLLLSYLAPITNPLKTTLIPLLGLGYQALLLVHILFLIYWLIRLPTYMLLSGVSILCGFSMIAKNWGFHFSNAPGLKASSQNLRVMNYNVHDFMSPFDGSGTQKQIAKIIKAKQPDILAIEEYTVNILDCKATNAVLINAMSTPHHYFKGYDCTNWDSTGLAIYSHYPLINHGIVVSTNQKNVQVQAIFVDVKYKNKGLRIYAMHLKPIEFEASEHQYLHDFAHKGKISVHEWIVIINKLRAAYRVRSMQVALIKSHMAKCPYPYILAGDFNDTPVSYSVNELGRGLKNAFRECGSGMGITYWGDFPHLQIDYILCHPRFNILNYQVITQKVSDHYPIISDLLLQ
jgi:endonuclease/exonuclease/phosphatase family metal-dependent hydrolase